MSFATDTIAALATPIGTSAIAVVRASGSSAAEITKKIFSEIPPPRFARHADYRDKQDRLIDDVLFTFFAAPNSFTGEDSLEISCHGNPFIAQKILEDLFARGCRPAEAGEFTKRAFLNGRMDLSQAEAVMDLIHARSERALAAANQQLRGALGRKMDELISLLLKVLAHIEAYIDFPEEDLPAEDRQLLLRDLRKLQAGTAKLLATSHYGEMLRDGIKTVIIGEPNAGKSSLLNRLVGRERALVSPEPGTTRDYIEERVIIGSHWLRLIDTAGLNETPSAIERHGIHLALEQAGIADIFLWVIDSTRPLPILPPALLSRMSPTNTIAVYNKHDLVPSPQITLPASFEVVSVSAVEGSGIEELLSTVSKLAEGHKIEMGDELIAINARHSSSLDLALINLGNAVSKLSDNTPSELVSSDLRVALEAYGQISGKVDNERMLDQLFATFCIGK